MKGTTIEGTSTEGTTIEEVEKMTNVGEVYRCEICGNVVEVKTAGVGVLVCCGQNMTLVTEAAAETTTAPAGPESTESV